ncbi:hypothetical protein Mro03_37430 [Microbispora rosea subsp. rosea]|nr:hypothetical protein Mro03_37430 [Microbispora rosea subsp. rosea]
MTSGPAHTGAGPDVLLRTGGPDRRFRPGGFRPGGSGGQGGEPAGEDLVDHVRAFLLDPVAAAVEHV